MTNDADSNGIHQMWPFSKRRTEALKAWEKYPHGEGEPMPVLFHAGFSMGVGVGAGAEDHWDAAHPTGMTIAAKLREQNPSPRADMSPDDYCVAAAIEALARALGSTDPSNG